MPNTTLATNAAIETRKQIVGIAKSTAANSIASAITSMATRTSKGSEVSKTKKAAFLIPFLVGIKKLDDVLTEARDGGVKTKKAPLGERTLVLANELVTDPVQYRPADGKVLEKPELLQSYKDGFSITAQTAKDRNFLETIVSAGAVGSATGEKSKVIDSSTANTAQDKVALLDEAIDHLYDFKDGVFQTEFEDEDLVIVVGTKFHRAIKNVAKYNTASGDRANAAFTNGKIPSALYDGVKVVKTKHMPAGTDFIILVGGAAVQQFLFTDEMNMDKQEGVNAYTLSLEFTEGTAVWFPQLIVIGSTTIPKQDAVGMGDDLDFSIMEQASVEGTDPVVSPNPAPPAPAAKTTSPASPAPATAFDPATFNGDVMTLTGKDRTVLKAFYNLPPNASNDVLKNTIAKVNP